MNRRHSLDRGGSAAALRRPRRWAGVLAMLLATGIVWRRLGGSAALPRQTQVRGALPALPHDYRCELGENIAAPPWADHRHWLRWLVVCSIALLLLLAVLMGRLTTMHAQFDCLLESVGWPVDGAACRGVLAGLLGQGTVIDAGAAPQPPGLADAAKTWFEAWFSYPTRLLWADNLLVDMYTLCFVALTWRAAARLLEIESGWRTAALRVAFWLTVAMCLLGAMADHGENFWLLARLGQREDPTSQQLAFVSFLTHWKYRLFFFNLLLVVGWWQLLRVRLRSRES